MCSSVVISRLDSCLGADVGFEIRSIGSAMSSSANKSSSEIYDETEE